MLYEYDNESLTVRKDNKKVFSSQSISWNYGKRMESNKNNWLTDFPESWWINSQIYCSRVRAYYENKNEHRRG